jgi:hypothetical protein
MGGRRVPRVVKLEVEKREWDFASDRANPQLGRAVDRISVTFSETRATPAAR